MAKSLIAVVVLFFSIFFLPFWIQVVLYVLTIILVRYRLLVLIPAICADAWYASAHTFSLNNNKVFLLVTGMLLVYLLVIRNTRILQRYGLEKK